ncbi:hypothetical protein CTI12_AA307460 [Artemisia annua]|uniref:Calcium ion-binding protein n=1 Tax=Artemisia annua TaxID=35608 RepID=A0A2U1N505_ARTAN|nr:hypothetical protein CTI12_AA307460 [Artemisia annua]
MGLLMSFMGRGLPTTQMLSLVMGTLHSKFMEKDIKEFDDFHVAILDMFNTINAALPGKHYDVPPPKKVEEIFVKWKDAKDAEKKKLFIDFMKTSVSMSKIDDSILITGLVTPPAAMAAKRAGESLPQLKAIKVIPDVLFVPSATHSVGGLSSFSLYCLPTTQMLSLVMGTLHSKFMEKDIKEFDDFHVAILDMFNTINAALPGKHYDVPPPKKVEEIFVKWKDAKDAEKKKLFIDFMKTSVSMSKIDDSILITGLVTPPAAMAAKRAGESLPQLKAIKVIPDVLFVPSATVLALISAKLSKKMFLGNVAS